MGSGDGVQHSESLRLWNLSIVLHSKNKETQRFGKLIWIQCFKLFISKAPNRVGI
jgi:hypothetical protein